MPSAFPCPDSLTDCECLPFPVRNFSVETPDVPVFLGAYSQPPTVGTFFAPACFGVCESLVSQELADECAQRAAFECSLDGAPRTGNPTPGGIFPPRAFRNTTQECAAECDDGNTTTVVEPAGTVVSYTQADADARAHALACKRAKELLVCFVTANPLPSIVINTFASLPVIAIGGNGDYEFTLTSGSLPPGMSLDPVGLISGTPTVLGTSTFILTVADTGGGTATKTYGLTVTPAGSDVPCDLGVADNTDFGDRSVNTCLAGSTDSWTGLPIGTYTVAYVSGGVSYTDLDFAAACTVPLGTTSWVANPFGVSAGINSNARLVRNGSTLSQLPFQFPSIVCGRLVTADKSLPALEADFGGSTTGGLQSLESTITLAVAITYPDSASVVPVAWKLTRVKKTAIDYDIQVRITNLSSILSSLTPFDSCTAGSGTVWDGTFPAFEPEFDYANYDYRVSHGFGAFQLNSCRLDTPAVTKVYHDTAGQDTPTGCAWILAVTYKHPSGNRVSWVGLGGNGYSPVGTYVFSSTVVGWTMVGKKTAVRVATTSALPANTRIVNTITADAVGALPAIDGVSLAPGDRVLLKDEALGANNGVYTVTSLGSAGTQFVLDRSADLDTSAEMIRGIFMPVTSGATNSGRHFRLVTDGIITLNATALSFTAIAITIAVEQY